LHIYFFKLKDSFGDRGKRRGIGKKGKERREEERDSFLGERKEERGTRERNHQEKGERETIRERGYRG